MIVNTIFSSFSIEDTSSKNDSQDNPHLSEYVAEFYVHCDSDALLVTTIITVVVQYK